MAEIIITDGSTDVDLTNDDPEVVLQSEQLTETLPYFGVDASEITDLRSSVNIITINARIHDVAKFNNLQAHRVSGNTLTVKWNDNEGTKPKLDLKNATGTATCVIMNVGLVQRPGPATEYELNVKLGIIVS